MTPFPERKGTQSFWPRSAHPGQFNAERLPEFIPRAVYLMPGANPEIIGGLPHPPPLTPPDTIQILKIDIVAPPSQPSLSTPWPPASIAVTYKLSNISRPSGVVGILIAHSVAGGPLTVVENMALPDPGNSVTGVITLTKWPAQPTPGFNNIVLEYWREDPSGDPLPPDLGGSPGDARRFAFDTWDWWWSYQEPDFIPFSRATKIMLTADPAEVEVDSQTGLMLPGQVITFKWSVQTDTVQLNKATQFPGFPSAIQFQVWLGRAKEFDPVPGIFVESPGGSQFAGSFNFDASNKPFNSPFAQGQNIAVLSVFWPSLDVAQFQPATGQPLPAPEVSGPSRFAVVTIQAHGTVPPGVTGLSSLTFANCSTTGNQMFVWVNDFTAAGGWQQRLTLASSYDPNSGGCGPAIAPNTWQPGTVSFQTGHAYEIRVIDPSALGCGSNDVQSISCIRWDSGVFYGDSKGASQTITIPT
jgi:hypothetical protein